MGWKALSPLTGDRDWLGLLGSACAHLRSRGSRKCGHGHEEQLGCGLVATVFWPVMLVFTIHIFTHLMLCLARGPFCRA